MVELGEIWRSDNYRLLFRQTNNKQLTINKRKYGIEIGAEISA